MDSCQPNKCIKCTVPQCKYHTDGDYCSLDCITIVSHELNPTMCECTDCQSFVLRD